MTPIKKSNCSYIIAKEHKRLVFNMLIDLRASADTSESNLWSAEIVDALYETQHKRLSQVDVVYALESLSDEGLVCETERGWELC